MPRRILLHIGWPKTGTTTLQKHVLPKVPGFRYLGKTPFVNGANAHTFQLVFLLAYASDENFDHAAHELWRTLAELETGSHGAVDPTIPMIISDEGVLGSLLKPSDHQHHGFSTASLHGIARRLRALEGMWDVRFEMLITERDPLEIIHAYYAQMYTVFREFRGLGSFKAYVKEGIAELPGRELGFKYLRPGYVCRVLEEHLGGRLHAIHMSQLFTTEGVRLHEWYHGFPKDGFDAAPSENRRSVGANVKIAHLRPIWVPRQRFRLREFLRTVRLLFRERYSDHSKLEIPVVMTGQERKALTAYLDGSG